MSKRKFHPRDSSDFKGFGRDLENLEKIRSGAPPTLQELQAAEARCEAARPFFREDMALREEIRKEVGKLAQITNKIMGLRRKEEVAKEISNPAAAADALDRRERGENVLFEDEVGGARDTDGDSRSTTIHPDGEVSHWDTGDSFPYSGPIFKSMTEA